MKVGQGGACGCLCVAILVSVRLCELCVVPLQNEMCPRLQSFHETVRFCDTIFLFVCRLLDVSATLPGRVRLYLVFRCIGLQVSGLAKYGVVWCGVSW